MATEHSHIYRIKAARGKTAGRGAVVSDSSAGQDRRPRCCCIRQQRGARPLGVMAVVSWPAVLPRASRRHGTTASPNIRCNTISHCRCYFAIATQYHITLLHVAVITLPSLYNKPLLL